MEMSVTRTRGALPANRQNKGTVWLTELRGSQRPGTSDPRDCKALANTSAQCTLMPSDHRGRIHLCFWSNGKTQDLSVLKVELSLTVNELDLYELSPSATGPEAPCICHVDNSGQGISKT